MTIDSSYVREAAVTPNVKKLSSPSGLTSLRARWETKIHCTWSSEAVCCRKRTREIESDQSFLIKNHQAFCVAYACLIELTRFRRTSSDMSTLPELPPFLPEVCAWILRIEQAAKTIK